MKKYCDIVYNSIQNDQELISQSMTLMPFYQPSASITDFTTLLYAGNIYTQMSGFCIAPYLISNQKQKICLIDKHLHDINDFPFLDKDWSFFNNILNAKTEANPTKKLKIIKNI